MEGDPAKRTAAALKSLDAYEEALREKKEKEEADKEEGDGDNGAEEEEEMKRTGKDGVEVVLSPSKHTRRIKSTKQIGERVLSESTVLNVEADADAANGKAAAGAKKEDKSLLSSMRRSGQEDALQAIRILREKGAIAAMLLK